MVKTFGSRTHALLGLLGAVLFGLVIILNIYKHNIPSPVTHNPDDMQQSASALQKTDMQLKSTLDSQTLDSELNDLSKQP